MTAIPLAALGKTEKIGEGGMATIHLTPTFRIPGEHFEPVFKRYKRKVLPVSLHGLEQIVAVRNRMPADQRELLDERATWPLAVVESEGHAVGVMMRLIPPEFFQRLDLRGKFETKPREIQFAMQDEAFTHRVGLPSLSGGQRLTILREFARVLAALHAADVVYGDISARNVLYAVDPEPRVMLVDCDATRARSAAAVFGSQPHSPDWEPPEALRARARQRYLKAANASPSEITAMGRRWALQNVETDIYKFGLLALRLFNPGPGGSLLRDAARFTKAPPALRQHLALTLDQDPRRRPSIESWYELLKTGGTRPLAARSGGPAPAERSSTPSVAPGPTVQSLRKHGAWEEQPDGSWSRVQ